MNSHRIHLLTNWADNVLNYERNQNSLPWLHCFRKKDLSGDTGAERIASALYDAAVFVLTNASIRTKEPLIRHSFAGLIGCSNAMNKTYDLLERIGKSEATVLVNGESGTGKELVARALHNMSERASKPFRILNCATLSASLIESQLFGYVKGAFTGAAKDTKGLLDAADCGTLFIDEVGELPISSQPKLLRFIQEHTFMPVGADVETTLDVRILAATNKNLTQQISLELFREDLYWRLNVIQVKLPKLCERGCDVMFLAQHFLKKHLRTYKKNKLKGFSPSARNAIMSFKWPGNVRELENVIEGAVVLAQGSLIEESDLPDYVIDEMNDSRADIDQLRECLHIVLEQNDGNILRTAELLGLDRKTVYRLLRVKKEIPLMAKHINLKEDEIIHQPASAQTKDHTNGFPDFERWPEVEAWLNKRYLQHCQEGINETKCYGKVHEARICIRHILLKAIHERPIGPNIETIQTLVTAIRDHGSKFVALRSWTPEKRFWFVIMGFIYYHCDGGKEFLFSKVVNSEKLLLDLKDRLKDFVSGLKDEYVNVTDLIGTMLK